MFGCYSRTNLTYDDDDTDAQSTFDADVVIDRAVSKACLAIAMLWINCVIFTCCLWGKVMLQTLYTITTALAYVCPFQTKIEQRLFKTALKNGTVLY
eukprot:2922591-Rhodomonas_salina.2